MDFELFSRSAERCFAGIPPEFVRGITGVHVHRGAKVHPEMADYYTLGECGDDEAAALTDPEALLSRIHLYYGSFRAIAAREPGFDWEEELRETILHEVRHHLEDRAGIPDLRIEDAIEEARAAAMRRGEEER
jgi:hypothetical protein